MVQYILTGECDTQFKSVHFGNSQISAVFTDNLPAKVIQSINILTMVLSWLNKSHCHTHWNADWKAVEDVSVITIFISTRPSKFHLDWWKWIYIFFSCNFFFLLLLQQSSKLGHVYFMNYGMNEVRHETSRVFKSASK